VRSLGNRVRVRVRLVRARERDGTRHWTQPARTFLLGCRFKIGCFEASGLPPLYRKWAGGCRTSAPGG
jgi:hypothetical protein